MTLGAEEMCRGTRWQSVNVPGQHVLNFFRKIAPEARIYFAHRRFPRFRTEGGGDEGLVAFHSRSSPAFSSSLDDATDSDHVLGHAVPRSRVHSAHFRHVAFSVRHS